MGIEILNPLNKGDLIKIKACLSNKNIAVIDTIASQLEEIYFIRNPKIKPFQIKPQDITAFVNSFYPNNKQILFGYWIYYPWNHQLVHFLPEDMHTELRTARNRNLITKEEQNIYYHSTIGIAGLSVGNSAMAALLYSGGPKNLRLADLDTLSGSNINRIRTGFSNINLKKVEIAAREIYQVNPFANLTLLPDGLDEKNMENFLTKPKPLDVLIEEMDNIYLKIKIRLLARKHRIPVIMAADNGDNIILDIERYDLEPDRPILHGDIPESKLLKIKADFNKAEAAKIISKWVKPENVAVRMQESLFELGKTLYSWPQLGIAAFLAGCALAYSARKIILKQPIKQGKFLVSLDEKLIPDYFSNKSISTRKKQVKIFKQRMGIS